MLNLYSKQKRNAHVKTKKREGHINTKPCDLPPKIDIRYPMVDFSAGYA